MSPSIEPAEFQIEDMEHLTDRNWSANWSEMLAGMLQDFYSLVANPEVG